MIAKHEQLRSLIYKGAEEKKLDITDIVLDRIDYELSIIKEQGHTDYFIIYSGIIGICKELNLLRSPGRGSAAGSLVNYCLDITKVNPVDENLIFERFVHPQQKGLPDIDIDIPKGEQKKVVENFKRKYPEYSTYFIAFLPNGYTDYEDIIFNNAIYKKHPCGIIIMLDELTNSTFLYEEREFYCVHDIQTDPIYHNRFDILELEYLNRLQLIVDEIGDKYHPYKLPLNDKSVFNFFASEDLEHVFQFSSPRMQRVLSQFKPNSISDLAIINAIYRPDVLRYIPTLIDNKFNSKESFFSRDKRVSEILDETYGLVLYQETVLRLANEIAGISYPDAVTWQRRTNRDKSDKELITFSSVFSDGCKGHSALDEIEIASLTNLITGMMPLTFLKSHSLCYSTVGYWSCFYKTHFRKEFEMAFNETAMV